MPGRIGSVPGRARGRRPDHGRALIIIIIYKTPGGNRDSDSLSQALKFSSSAASSTQDSKPPGPGPGRARSGGQ
eukprot:768820-Hanusia_phi.AAC.2